MKLSARLTVLATIGFCCLAADLPPASDLKVDFQQHIAPLIREKCMPCHDTEMRQGELRLNNRTNFLRGGVTGSAIEPGDSAASLLIHRIASSENGPQMPLTGPLSEEEIGRLRAWIDQGAPWTGTLVAAPEKLEVSDEAAALFESIRQLDQNRVARALDATPWLAKARDEDGSSPLMLAGLYADAGMMRLLLERDADPNAKNVFGATALMWVADDFEKAKLLIDASADVNARDEDGYTPSMVAAGTPRGGRTLGMLIESGADLEAERPNGTGLLQIAAGSGALQSVELLLEKGLDVNHRQRNGRTALIAALSGEYFDIARLLLEQGANPAFDQRDGTSAIGLAAIGGDLETVKLLVKAGADVNQVGRGGYTPLMWATYSYQPNYSLVGWLMANGVEVGAKGGDGLTAAALAERKNDKELLRLLAGASR